MWGREKGLGYWLLHNRPEKRRGIVSAVWTRIRHWLGCASAGCRVEGFDVALAETQAISPPLLPLDGAVVNGLALTAPAAREEAPSTLQGEPLGAETPRVLDFGFCSEAAAIDLPLTVTRKPAIGECRCLMNASVRSAAVHPANGVVRGVRVQLREESSPVQTGQYWLYGRLASVRVATPRILRLPHLRRSAEVNCLGAKETQKYLQEAARLRGVQSGELLAVFSRVPVELMADYRYVKAKGLLLYTLATENRMRWTRVHDLAAVAERSTGQTYLVAHPTRYRTAYLH